MLPLFVIIVIAAVVIFIYLKNKQENRNADRHNRLVEKQEELMKMLKEQKDIKHEN